MILTLQKLSFIAVYLEEHLLESMLFYSLIYLCYCHTALTSSYLIF